MTNRYLLDILLVEGKVTQNLYNELIETGQFSPSTIVDNKRIYVTLILEHIVSDEEERYVSTTYDATILYVSEVAPIMTLEISIELAPLLIADSSVKIVRAYETPSIEPLDYDYGPDSDGGWFRRNSFRLAAMNKVSLDEIVKALGVDKLHAMGYDGEGIIVAVVDSGTDINHPMLKGHVEKAFSVVDYEPTNDELGHSTHVASIIAKLAPKARIWSYKIFKKAEGDISQAMFSLERAAMDGVHIINASWGASQFDPIDLLVESLTKQYGVTIISAAGNTDSDGVTSPARSPGALAVGSVALHNPYPGAIASFSSKGPEVDLVSYGGSDEELIEGAKANSNDVTYFRGTSQSAPQVSAIAAILYKKFGKNVKDRLIASAIDLGPKGSDTNFGFGLLNGLGALAGETFREKTDTPQDSRQQVFPPVAYSGPPELDLSKILIGGVAVVALYYLSKSEYLNSHTL